MNDWKMIDRWLTYDWHILDRLITGWWSDVLPNTMNDYLLMFKCFMWVLNNAPCFIWLTYTEMLKCNSSSTSSHFETDCISWNTNISASLDLHLIISWWRSFQDWYTLSISMFTPLIYGVSKIHLIIWSHI